jgi:hypothetical protein
MYVCIYSSLPQSLLREIYSGIGICNRHKKEREKYST